MTHRPSDFCPGYSIRWEYERGSGAEPVPLFHGRSDSRLPRRCDGRDRMIHVQYSWVGFVRESTEESIMGFSSLHRSGNGRGTDRRPSNVFFKWARTR